MVNYKDLGLVNTREMFAKAIKGGYAIPAFNSTTWSNSKLLLRLLPKPSRRLSSKYPKVRVTTLTVHSSAT